MVMVRYTRGPNYMSVHRRTCSRGMSVASEDLGYTNQSAGLQSERGIREEA